MTSFFTILLIRIRVQGVARMYKSSAEADRADSLGQLVKRFNSLQGIVGHHHMPKPSKISMCGLYIPPCNSPYFNVELFEELDIFLPRLNSPYE